MNKLFGIAISYAFLVNPAFAVPITFEFGAEGTGSIVSCCYSDDYDRYVASVGGVDLTVRGYEDADLDPVGSSIWSTFGDREQVTRDTGGSHQGLGVESDHGDTGRINGDEYEALRFFLSMEGYLTQIVFNNWDLNNYEEFDLSIDGYGALNNEETDDESNVWNGYLRFDSRFAIGADSGNENFRIRSITVDIVTVPEPGTLALFGLGLLGLAATRRRSIR